MYTHSFQKHDLYTVDTPGEILVSYIVIIRYKTFRSLWSCTYIGGTTN